LYQAFLFFSPSLRREKKESLIAGYTFPFCTVRNPSSDFPIPPAALALFIAHLYQQNCASSTVNTYVSALGYLHRLAGVPDPTKVFFTLEMLKGYGKVDPRFEMRMPLSIPILTKIFQQCPSTLDSHYVSTMFKAMSVMTFFLPFCALVK